LSTEKARLRIKGRSLTKPGPLLKDLVPLRVFFAGDERKPGFFELDTVCHCGSNASGEFCCALTLADAYQSLTPLINFFYPATKLIGKEKQPNGRSKKTTKKFPKLPANGCLSQRIWLRNTRLNCAVSLNSVELKGAFNRCRERLLQFNREKGRTVSGSA
jgi:hypothetical protein